jgi:hypothetical protein
VKGRACRCAHPVRSSREVRLFDRSAGRGAGAGPGACLRGAEPIRHYLPCSSRSRPALAPCFQAPHCNGPQAGV